MSDSTQTYRLSDIAKTDNNGVVTGMPNYGNILQNAAKGLGQFNDQFQGEMANVGSLGLAGLIDNKIPNPAGGTYQTIPDEPTTTAGRIGKFGGGVAGWTMGGPGKLGEAALGVLPEAMQISSKMGPTLAKGALEMGAGRAGFIPANMAQGADIKSEAAQTALMAGMGAGTAGIGKGLFGRQYAAKSLTPGEGGAKDQMNSMYQELLSKSEADPNLQADPTKLFVAVDDALKKMKVPTGPAAQVLRRWQTYLGSMKSGEKLTAQTLEELRTDMGALAKLGTTESGGVQVPMSGFKKPMAQSAVHDIGGMAKDHLAELADKAGMGDTWKAVNEETSSLKGAVKKPSLMHQLVSAGIPGAIGGGATMAVTGDPRLSAGVGATAAGLANPFVRNALFSGIEKTGFGKIAKVGIGVRSAESSKR